MRRAAAIAASIMLLGCPGPDTGVTPPVERWLTCEECANGELAAVRALGASAKPALASAVRGPSPQAIENMTRSSANAWARARRYSLTLAPAERSLRPLGDSAAYTARNVDNYRALYQMRAAVALNVIDPAAARITLRSTLVENDSAARRFLRADVRSFVDSLARGP